jgi:hypothetical protein
MDINAVHGLFFLRVGYKLFRVASKPFLPHLSKICALPISHAPSGRTGSNHLIPIYLIGHHLATAPPLTRSTGPAIIVDRGLSKTK